MPNENEIKNNPTEVKNPDPNKQFFDETVTSRIPEDKLKQNIGGLSKEWERGQTKEELTDEHKKKIEAYDNLETKGLPEIGLPENWKDKLARLKNLEEKEAKYEKGEKDLAEWTNTFQEEKTAIKVAEKIKTLTKDYNDTKSKLESWQNTFVGKDPTKLEEEKNTLQKKNETLENELKKWNENFPEQDPLKIKEKISELEKQVTGMGQVLDSSDPEEVKKMIAQLKKRPNLPFTEEVFYADYANREKLSDTKLRVEELDKEKEKNSKLQTEKKQYIFIVKRFLENGRIKRYVLAKAVLNEHDAKTAIVELLEKTKKEWEEYLDKGDGKWDNIANVNLNLGLSWDGKITLNEENKVKALQILVWIKEALDTKNYQKLFDDWTKFGKEYDFDGTLRVLGKYLEVKDNPTTTI